MPVDTFRQLTLSKIHVVVDLLRVRYLKPKIDYENRNLCDVKWEFQYFRNDRVYNDNSTSG